MTSTWFLSFNQAAGVAPELLGGGLPGLPLLPHRFLSNPTIFSLASETALARAGQMQAAKFFEGIPNPDPNQFLMPPFSQLIPVFELSAHIPEQLNFLQVPK